jgi:hypothetical protein
MNAHITAEKIRYDENFVRSAIAPEAIVTAVAAKTAWKKNVVAGLSPPPSGIAASSRSSRKNCSCPMNHPPLAEREGEPRCEEREDADDRVRHVLGEDVDDVLRPGEARLDQCEARLHEEHQHAGDEHPDVVQVVLGGRDVVLGEADGWGDGQDGDDATQAGNDSKRSVAHGSSRGIGNGDCGVQWRHCLPDCERNLKVWHFSLVAELFPPCEWSRPSGLDPRVKWRGRMEGMDLSYPPEAEEFRAEIRTWLHDNLPDGWFDDDFEMTDEERKQFNEEWPTEVVRGRLDLRDLARRIRRQGTHHDAGRRAVRGVRERQGADAR